MGMLKKWFGSDSAPTAEASASRFPDSDPHEASTELGSRQSPRRDLVQVVLRDTMRRHGIPSDWIECRILSVASRTRKDGMHVQFVVKAGQDRLLTYMPAFQSSFMAEIGKFESRPSDWLFSLSWQIQAHDGSAESEPPRWSLPDAAGAAQATAAPQGADKDGDADEDVMDDIQALYAAMQQPLPMAGQAPGAPPLDFQPTRPGFENTEGGPGR